MTSNGAIEGTTNADGSHDFTLVQIAGGAAYLYAGLYAANTMAPTPLGQAPTWIALLSVPAPISDKLVFGSAIIPYATAATLGATPNTVGAGTIVSLVNLQGRLYLTVQDSQGRTTGLDARSNATMTKIPGSYYVEIGRAMAVILPANLTSFTYAIDASKASQPRENYAVALGMLGDSGFVVQEAFAAGISKGSTATYGAGISSGGITNVELYAVSLDAVDSLGLPATDAVATLSAASGVSVTISPGAAKMLPGGEYSLSMDYRGQNIHENVTVARSGALSVKVQLSIYGLLLIVGIVAALAGTAFVTWRRRGKMMRERSKVSEWLR
jgi:hypothetical protein